MAVKLSALRVGRPLPVRKIHGTHFSYRLSRPQSHNAAGRIRSIEKWKKPMNSSVLEPATFRLAAQCLNQPRCRVPLSRDWILDLLTTCIHNWELHFTVHCHTQTSVLSLLQPPLAVSWQRILTQEL
jgi:hypothetical protein